MWLSSLILLLLAPDDREAEEAIRKFRVGMKSPENSARAQAVAELGRTQHEKTMKVLGFCLETDDRSVRIAAAKALGAFQEKKRSVAALLEESLAHKVKETEKEVANA